jgi:hypothetical protein
MGEKVNSAGSAGDPWVTELPGSYIGNQAGMLMSIVQKILRNKIITDSSTGKYTVYDDNGTSVLLEGNLWEDADGTQAYQGSGAERRDRLT